MMEEMNNMELDNVDLEAKEGFWQKRVAMPVVFVVGGVSVLIGGVVGCLSGKAWAKKASKEREEANAQPAPAAQAQPEAAQTTQAQPEAAPAQA
jgi:hypothetical protein